MLDRIFKKLAKKYNLDERIVREICISPFRFTSSQMRKAESKPIMIRYIGKILPKKISIGRLNEINKKQNELNSMNSRNSGDNNIDKN